MKENQSNTRLFNCRDTGCVFIKCGLYKDGNFIYNADAVGAYNIIRLYAKENSKQIALPKVMLSNPFTVNIYNKM